MRGAAVRRLWLLLWAASVVALCAGATSEAWAGTWVVKSKSGARIGTVRVNAAGNATVRNRAGALRGYVVRVNSNKWAAEQRLTDGQLRNLMLIRRGYPGLERWTFWSGDDNLTGRIMHRARHRWSAESVGDFYHIIGYVPDKCPAPLAGGAVFVLRPKYWPGSW
jgi:hypothetical protein